eukprot:Tbor_TRINITY_DN5288_c1_g7::TRINITY_DN5288_c1_g7_i1::g.16356::m.16356/K02335/DPO1, polA; DNA polymerase I
MNLNRTRLARNSNISPIVGIVDVDSNVHRSFNVWYTLTQKMGQKVHLGNFMNKQAFHTFELATTAHPPFMPITDSSAPKTTGSVIQMGKVIFCKDLGCGGREKAFPEYKGHRPPKKEGLDESFEIFYKALDVKRASLKEAGIVDELILELPGRKGNRVLPDDCDAEADDFIATAAHICRENGLPSCIFSGDRDMFQLVDNDKQCYFYDTLKKQYFDEEAVKERVGVLPSQYLAHKVLTGDASDNIKGCEKVGVSRATQLLSKYNTLDNIFRVALEKVDVKGGAKKNGKEECKIMTQSVRKSLVEYSDKYKMTQQIMSLQIREEAVVPIKGFLGII